MKNQIKMEIIDELNADIIKQVTSKVDKQMIDFETKFTNENKIDFNFNSYWDEIDKLKSQSTKIMNDHAKINKNILEFSDKMVELSKNVSLNTTALYNKVGIQEIQKLDKNLGNFVKQSELKLVQNKLKIYINRDELHEIEINFEKVLNSVQHFVSNNDLHDQINNLDVKFNEILKLKLSVAE